MLEKNIYLNPLVSFIQLISYLHQSITYVESTGMLVCISPYTGSLAAWLASVSHRAPRWGQEGQTREDELGCSLPCRHTISGRWGRDSVDGGKGRALWWKQKDDWFTGCLQCTEIIPLAAQLAWTWSMIPNVCLQTGWDSVQRWGWWGWAWMQMSK